MSQELKPFTVPLDAELKAALAKLAKEDERKLASYVRKILKEHVASQSAKGKAQPALQ